MEMRSVSSQSANVLNQYRSAFRDFASRQNESNGANAARLQRLNGLRDERISETQSRMRAWRVMDDRRSPAALAALTTVDAAAIVSSLNASAGDGAPTQLRFDPAAIDAVIKQLVDIQRPLTLAQRAQNFADFGQKLRDSYQTAVAQAGGEAEGAGNDSAAATSQVPAAHAGEPNENN
jgi:hypothetical protein